MENFNIGALRLWKPVATGELLEFDVPGNGYRAVALDVLSDSYVTVKAVAGDEYWLLGAGTGHLSLKFSTDRTVAVVALGDPNADVFIRTRTETQVVPESDEASYTTIEPRHNGPSEEVRQMMQIMRLNEARRDRQLREQMAIIEEERSARKKAEAAAEAKARAENEAAHLATLKKEAEDVPAG